jgi:hypothetical protein
VCLLFFNGLRASEAAAARLDDVDEHGGHRVLWVRGKGETETNQRVPLNGPRSLRSSAGYPCGPPSPAPTSSCCCRPRRAGR